MKIFVEKIITNFVEYAFLIGVLMGGLLMLLSYGADDSSRVNALLINLSGDFLILGLTITLVDRLIKKSELQKLGTIPKKAKSTINNEVWNLFGSICIFVRDSITMSTQEIIDSGLVEEAYSEGVSIKTRMNILQIAELKVADDNMITFQMFSDVLVVLRKSVSALDTAIARYSYILNKEDIGRAIALRDEIENISRIDMLITLGIPLKAQNKPNSLLGQREKSTFNKIRLAVIELQKKLL